jgi:membrane peptidoglycan carboxypeptidase
VAYKPQKSHAKSLPKLGKKTFEFSKKVLVFIGKPFYLLIFFFLKLLDTVKYLKIPVISLPKLPQFQIRITKITLAPIIFMITLFSLGYYAYYLLPPANELTNRNFEVSTKIFDRNGTLLYQIYKNKNRSLIAFDTLPKNVIDATLAAEDAEFYSHPGFSIRGIIRASINNFRNNKLTGGSTITQQLVKNALLTPEKTLTRKIKEIILAIKVEATFPKDKILEMYLNEVSYGGTAYGISEASRIYFGKEVGKLNLAEAAFLAGLPKSPSRLSPFGQNPNLAFERQREVLHLMTVNKFISFKEEKEALDTNLTFAPQKIDIQAPHFTMWVKEQLEERYGKEMVASGGLNVRTTLDLNIQKLAEKAVSEEIDKLKSLNVTNAGVVVLNPQTGEVLAMVGSKNYFDTKAEGNVNTTISPRPPGSSIKVVNYAYALANGYTPASIIDDSPITFNVKDQEPYIPKNYDSKFRGRITLRSALAESRNIPAVKVLNSYGVDKMVKLGLKMGITTWDKPERFGLSLTLGGGEVKLLDLAGVYATIANAGQKTIINPLIMVSDYKGKILETNPCIEKAKIPNDIAGFMPNRKPPLEIMAKDGETCQQETVIDPRVAYLLTDILKDNEARSPAFGRFSQLVISNHPEVAVKTGTSNSLRDNLTLGYNQQYLVAVWVGNNNNSPMSHVASGVTGASPIWNKIMSALIKNEPSLDWPIPEGVIKLPVCKFTGTLGCSGCSTNLEWFLEENAPQKKCDPEYINKLRENQLKKEGEIVEPAARVGF